MEQAQLRPDYCDCRVCVSDGDVATVAAALLLLCCHTGVAAGQVYLLLVKSLF